MRYADCHGQLPFPCRFPDARRYAQAAAFQGECHHQPDGRGWRRDFPDPDFHAGTENRQAQLPPHFPDRCTGNGCRGAAPFMENKGKSAA